jgi:hypothetical protein|tara:strand:+ start:42 stop:422 length:381 start_codon:yes stop_codon:yes gene_type:complete
MKDLITATNNLLAAMEADLKHFYSRSEYSYGEGYAEERMEDMVFHYEEGRNYIKLIKTEESERGHRSNVLGFIVKKSPKATDNKTKQPFNVGDMLMAAGYNAPATNFARGNVFEELNPANVRWTGI